MGALAAEYCEQLKKHFKVVYATFLPNEPLKLGDFGVLDDDVFVRLDNVTTAFGLKFNVRQGETAAQLDFATAGAVEVELKAAGQVPNVKASLEIKFSSKHAVFFNAAGCVSSSIEDRLALAKEIQKLREDGRWLKKYALVTTLITAGATTAIASASSESSIVLEAASDAVTTLDLSDASLKLQVKRSKDISLKIVTAGGGTPLLGLSGYKGGQLEPKDLRVLGPLSLPQEGTEVFTELW